MNIFQYLLSGFFSKEVRQFARAEEYLTALCSMSPEMTILLDAQNRVMYISLPLLRFAGLKSLERAFGKPVLTVITDAGLWDMIARVLEKNSNYRGVRAATMRGKHYYFRVVSKNIEKCRGRYINFVDITPEMTAKRKAEAASHSKSSFLATMSHEIRTPLNAVMGLSEIELQKKLPEDSHDNLTKIYNSGSSLLSIINDMLDISKIETGNFELIPVIYEVPNLIDDAVHLNIVRIGSKNIVFHLRVNETLPAKFFGDELRVKQIMNNLLSNAFKYTDEGTVRMDVDWEKKGDDAWITIVVSDTGLGIREEDIGKIYNEYCKFDGQVNRYIEGTGLGLPIAKKLTEMMDGTISVKSVYGEGTVFQVKIRQDIVDEKPIGREIAESLMSFRFMPRRRNRGINLVRANMPYGKVLVVDDVSTNLDVIKGLLLPYNLTIDCATGGMEAVEKIRQAGEKPDDARYDMVFMDHMMPGVDGIEAVRIIRNEIDNEYAKTVPVIALTANALHGNKEMFLSNGFNGFVSKPIDIMQLDAALNTWIRNKQSGDTIRRANMGPLPDGEPSKSTLPEGRRVEGVDLERGKEYYGDGKNYLKVIQSFCTHTPALLEKLRSLTEDLNPGALQEYAVAVHGLKGSCYGICADRAGAMAQTLEHMAKTGDAPGIRKEHPAFIVLVEKLLGDLETLLAEALSEKNTKQRAAAPGGLLLDKLLDACKYYRLSQMEEIIPELESCEYERGGELVRDLRKMMDNLEYEAMTEVLEKQNQLMEV
jgi:signal transduction histidine kinase/DNA-binding response OmpR family regulator